MPLAAPAHAADTARPRNIVFILGDDIGYGDFGCYGATKVKTPNVDRLATQGLRFTDAHSMASYCTPSRLLDHHRRVRVSQKGDRGRLGRGGAPHHSGPGDAAVHAETGGLLNGIIGKWHLGLGQTPTNYNGEITPGPIEVGFDYNWIIPATGDRVPCVWVENHRVANLDPADPIQLDYSVQRGAADPFVNGIIRIGKQTGGKAALWDDENISTVIAARSCAFIEEHKDKPFFLEVATHNIHVPRVPNPQFRGKSDCGPRGDTIVEFDWTVGQVLDKLDALGLADSTLVILSSDNGGINDNNGPDNIHGIGDPDATNGHKCNGVLRGTKGTVWEGGTRLPMITRWPGQIQPGVSDAMVCQVDFLASLASLTGQVLAENDAPDSFNVLPELLGQKPEKPGREYLVEQANNGALIALRKGTWKYLPGRGGKAGRKNAPKPENRFEAVADRDLRLGRHSSSILQTI